MVYLQVFEPFGQVELVQLPLDPQTGLCKGYGFIQVNTILRLLVVFLDYSLHFAVRSFSLHVLKMQELPKV